MKIHEKSPEEELDEIRVKQFIKYRIQSNDYKDTQQHEKRY